MLGYAHTAKLSGGNTIADVERIASYFDIPTQRLSEAVTYVENSDRPEILLLQNLDPTALVSATVFFSSVWSRAYEKFGTPFGRVHRDFHYQCLFCALSTLAEVGCDQVRVENPMSGRLWRRDAYVCLLEAVQNIQKYMNPSVNVFLAERTYDPQMPREVDADFARFDLQDHRPVGISPHVREGLNMRTVFVEKAERSMHGPRTSPSGFLE